MEVDVVESQGTSGHATGSLSAFSVSDNRPLSTLRLRGASRVSDDEITVRRDVWQSRR